jgi:anti-sigma factor RsiW
MSVAGDITCRELVDLITAYLDDAVPAAQRAEIDAHLAVCDGCTAAMEQFRETIRITGSLREEHVPESHRVALQDAFRSWWARRAPPQPAG